MQCIQGVVSHQSVRHVHMYTALFAQCSYSVVSVHGINWFADLQILYR